MKISANLLLFFIAVGLIGSAVLSISISNRLASGVSDKVQDNIVDLVFDSIESGPLTFARLHSSNIASQQLKQLMGTPAVSERNIVDVKIFGGADNYLYASWSLDSDIPTRCIVTKAKEYSYPSSLNPYEVQISVDKCHQLPERKEIFLFASLASGVAVLISGLLLLGSAWPVIVSLRVAHQIISSKNRDSRLMGKISFLPVRSLADLAIRSIDAERTEALNRMFRQVAHDIRSPLSAINLISSNLNEVSKDKRDLLRNATTRVSEIADSLLKRSYIQNSDEQRKLDSENFVNDYIVKFNLVSLAKQIVNEKRALLNTKTTITLIDLSSVPLEIVISKRDFQAMLSNLIDNAVESYQSFEKSVNIELSNSATAAIVKVIDQGSGIPDEIKDRIGQYGFTFGKAEQSSGSGSESGSGLGLYHARKTVEGLNGKLDIVTKIGKGTSIIISLPLANVKNQVVLTREYLEEVELKGRQRLILIGFDSNSIETLKTNVGFEQIRSESVSVIGLSQAEAKIDWISESDIVIYDFDAIRATGNFTMINCEARVSRPILCSDTIDNSDLIHICRKYSLQILPKMLLPTIPIRLS